MGGARGGAGRRGPRAKASPLLDRRRGQRFHRAVLVLKEIIDDFSRGGRSGDLGSSPEARALHQGMFEEASVRLEELKDPRTTAARRRRIVDDVCDAHHVLVHGAVYRGARA